MNILRFFGVNFEFYVKLELDGMCVLIYIEIMIIKKFNKLYFFLYIRYKKYMIDNFK